MISVCWDHHPWFTVIHGTCSCWFDDRRPSAMSCRNLQYEEGWRSTYSRGNIWNISNTILLFPLESTRIWILDFGNQRIWDGNQWIWGPWVGKHAHVSIDLRTIWTKVQWDGSGTRCQWAFLPFPAQGAGKSRQPGTCWLDNSVLEDSVVPLEALNLGVQENTIACCSSQLVPNFGVQVVRVVRVPMVLYWIPDPPCLMVAR